jgi:glucose/arabinose dehydrogenase
MVALAACTSTPAADPPAATPTAAPALVTLGDTITAGLSAPWGLVPVGAAGHLLSERDSGTVWLLTPAGDRVELGTVPGVRAEGEGGLLGLAVASGRPDAVYAYLTTAEDNRVVRHPWSVDGIGPGEPIITGIPRAGIHNGGRIAFGPDGMLYVGTGDAGDPSLAQDPSSLGGKVLRLTPDGAVPSDNPVAGSPVFTLGHRNVQGLAFDSSGTVWASEFGTSIADELNLLQPGGNYGWPVVEGAADQAPYIDPIAQWSPTSLASPSGIAYVGGESPAIYVASLRGEVLWQVPVVGDRAGEPIAVELGDLGRLRTVIAEDEDTLWLMTSNTDGRGEPRAEDDRIVQVELTPPA